MKNGEETVLEAPRELKEPLTIQQVRKFVKADVHSCMLMLEAIYRDENTLNAVAEYLLGRYENARLRNELSKQKDLGI